MRSLVVLASILALAGCEKSKADTTAPTAASAAPVAAKGKEVAVTVGEDGFAPAEVKVAANEATTLVFTRTTDKTCAKAVEFPELKTTKELPLNQPVAVAIPSGPPRTVAFQCGMGMYKSKVIVQ